MVTKSTARGELAIAQPELPDVGVGHRHRAPAPSPRGWCRRASSATLRRAAAPRCRRSRARIMPGNRLASATPVSICILVAVGMARQPEALACTFRPCRCGDLRRPGRGRSRPNRCARNRSSAPAAPGRRSICAARYWVERSSGRLRAAERRIGHAIELFAGLERRLAASAPGTEPPPDRGDDQRPIKVNRLTGASHLTQSGG